MLEPRARTTALDTRANPAAVEWKRLHDEAKGVLRAGVPAAVTDMSGAGFARGLEHDGALRIVSHDKFQGLLRASAAALKGGFELGFAEIGTPVTRAYADLDVRGALKMSRADMVDVALAMTEVLMECYPDYAADGDPRNRERAFRVVLLTAPSRHLGRDAGWKMGVHVVWPWLRVVREQLLLVRELWVRALDRTHPRGGLKNYWGDVVDAQVYLKGGGLRFPHSSKFEMCRACRGKDAAQCPACRGAARISVGRAYSVSDVLFPDGVRDAGELARLRGSLEAELLTCTIRTGLRTDDPSVARLEPPRGARPLEDVLRDARGRRSGVPTRLRRFAKWAGVDPDAPAYRAILSAARRTHAAFAGAMLSRVAISPNQKELVAVSLDVRFCPNLRREHNSRTIYWVASLVHMTIRTRCTCECPGRCKDWPGDTRRLDGGELASMFPLAADEVLGDTVTRGGGPGWAAAVRSGARPGDTAFWAAARGGCGPNSQPVAAQPVVGPGPSGRGRTDGPSARPHNVLEQAMTWGRSRAQQIIYGRHPTLVGHVQDRWNAAAGIRPASPSPDAGADAGGLSRASSTGSRSSAGSRTPRRAGAEAPIQEPPFTLSEDLVRATLGKRVVELSPDQREVLELVLGGNSVFVTGAAGCGKSTLVPIVIRAVRERFKLAPSAVAVTASTGIAAVRLQLNARTIHSYFGFKLGAARAAQARPDSVEALAPALAMAASAYSTMERQRALRDLRVLFIDEVSMLSADVLEAVSIVLRRAQTDPERARRPFGGVQVIVVGDFFQLAPVTGERDRDALAAAAHGGGGEHAPLRMRFAFESPVWAAAIRYTVCLSTNFRQSSASPEWRASLLRMRAGRPSDRDVAQLEEHMPVRGVAQPPDGWQGTVLVGTNAAASEHHQRALAALDGPALTIHSTIGIAKVAEVHRGAGEGGAGADGDTARRLRARILAAADRGGGVGTAGEPLRGAERELQRLCKNVLAPDALVLRRGVNVMCLANLDTGAGLCNGTLLRIVDIETRAPADNGGGWRPIEGDTTVRAGTAAAHRMRHAAWTGAARDLVCDAVLGVRVVAEYTHRGALRRVVIPLHCWSQRTRDRLAVAFMWQLPLRLSDAITVHKSQGMTLDAVALDLRGPSQHGLGYTAISRARDWAGIALLARFDPRQVFRVHPAVAQWADAVEPRGGEGRLRCRGPVFAGDRDRLSAALVATCRRMELAAPRTRSHAAAHMRHTVVTDEADAASLWGIWVEFEAAASVVPARRGAAAAKRAACPPAATSLRARRKQ